MVGGVGGVGQPEQQGTVATFGSGRPVNARGLRWPVNGLGPIWLVNGLGRRVGGDAGVAAPAGE
jgi:hypothetical protein